MPVIGVLRAKYDFVATSQNELSFRAGESIYLFHKDDSGWAKGGRTNGAKGWFPIDYTEPISDAPIPPPQPKTEFLKKLTEKTPPVPEDSTPSPVPTKNDLLKARHQIAFEILTTERTYMKHLITVMRLYYNPMKEGKIVDARDLSKIFCNLDKIHGVNSKLLIALEKRLEVWNDSSTMADIFEESLVEFGVYSDYLLNHHNAIVLINTLRENKKIANFLNNQKDLKECEGLDLLSYLIMPVQRILRYKLLLEDLLKKTPENNPDANALPNVLEKLSVLARDVNETLKKGENYERLMRIQKSFVGNVKNIVVENRRFIKEGALLKVCRKENKSRYFFLFSDALVYASLITGNTRQSTASSAIERITNPQQASNSKFLFHRMLYLKNTRAKSVDDSPTQKNAFQIITTEEKSFTVIANDAQTKAGWLKAIQDLTETQEIEEAAPVWLPDKDARECMVCNTKFTTFNRRHHCRYCGRVICGDCSSKKIKLATLSKNSVRVCDDCHRELSLKIGRQSTFDFTSSRSESFIKLPSTKDSSHDSSQQTLDPSKYSLEQLAQLVLEERSKRIISEETMKKDILALQIEIQELKSLVNQFMVPNRPPPDPDSENEN